MIVGVSAAALLAALHERCFPPDECWSEAAMRELLLMPGCFGWIGPDEEEPSGLALVRVAADEAELLTIGVSPSSRRGGEGARILRAVGAEAAARGAERLFLEVATGNAAARALYRRAGFEQAGLRRRYYPDGDDALVLAARLPLSAG